MVKKKKEKFIFPKIKKNLRWWVIVIIAGLVGAIFHVSMSQLSKPEFTITKEECWNKTTLESMLDGTFGRQVFLETIIERQEIFFELTGEYYKYTEEEVRESREEFYSITFDKEICEQIEVDDDWTEIEVCEKSEFKNMSDKDILIMNCFVQDKYASHKENGIFCCRNKYKKDLSTEWLDENCECLDCEGVHELDKEQCELVEELSCLKYKCGEYYVEVK